ncbi:hypothetical protein EDB84DRAFT_1484866, partial [Lactarius hengduanensis]
MSLSHITAAAHPRQLVAPPPSSRHMQAQHRHPAARKPRLPRRQAVATRKTNTAYKSPPPLTTAATTRTMATTLDIDDANDTNTGDTAHNHDGHEHAADEELGFSPVHQACLSSTCKKLIPCLPLQPSSLASPRLCRFAIGWLRLHPSPVHHYYPATAQDL